MEHEYKIGILGGGPAGVCAAYFLKDDFDVTLIDFKSPLVTLLPTGGGRCNLAYAEYDFKELAKNYPRGEKFLYSVFSRFSTLDTIDMFCSLGIETYTQDDGRIFPVCESSKKVREYFLNNIRNVHIKKEKGLRIERFLDKIKLITDMNSYIFDGLIFAIGGHSSFEMIEKLGIPIIKPLPSLVGLKTKEVFNNLSGLTIKNVVYENYEGDILFTHNGLSGPLIYKISSIYARNKFPYKLTLNLYNKEIDFQKLLDNNPHKQIINVLINLIPKHLAYYILTKLSIDITLKCSNINSEIRNIILNTIQNFEVTVVGTNKGHEVVTSGGVELNSINPKTLESKLFKGLYFAGEVLDIDGFCGGFNLQNCWSTAFVASNAIKNTFLKLN